MIPYVTFAYNTSYHSSTTFSPFYLLYLCEARIPIDLVMENLGEAVPAIWDDYVTEMRSRMEQSETNSVKPFRELNRLMTAVSRNYSSKWMTWCGFLSQKTSSSGTEVAIINHGTLAN